MILSVSGGYPFSLAYEKKINRSSESTDLFFSVLLLSPSFLKFLCLNLPLFFFCKVGMILEP